MITAFCVVVNKFFKDSAPFSISSIVKGVIVFLQERGIAVSPPRFTVFERRPTAKNGMAVKTPNYRFMHIIKVYAALADFSVAVARLFRKKAILKFLFVFRELMAVYDDHDFTLLF